MSILSTVANGLTGVVDRWESGEQYCPEALAIYKEVIEFYSPIAETINQKFETLGTNFKSASTPQRIQALRTVISDIALNQLNHHVPAFRLEEWDRFLKSQRRTKYDVVFIGGGPVGLWSAILTKIHFQALSILVLEKRTVYLRTHTLSIERGSFEGYVEGTCQECDNLVRDLKERSRIPINELENRLLDLARRVDIQVVFANVTSPEALSTYFPEAKMFVGADGARSTVRSQIFDREGSLNQTIHRLIQISYRIEKQETKSFHLLSSETGSAYPAIVSMNTTLIDERTNQREDSSNKILTFAVPEAIFTGMAGATFSNPFTLATPALPREIADDFFLWAGMKEEKLGEVRILNSEAIVGIDGEARISKTFVKSVKRIDGEVRYWFLVGDAAASFPLQRGFNVGIKCGIELARAVANYYRNETPDLIRDQEGIAGEVPASLAAYGVYGNRIKGEELCFLICPLTKKQWGITLWKTVTGVGSCFPGIASLDSTTAKRYRENGANPGRTAMGHVRAIQGSITAQQEAALLQVTHVDQQNITPQNRIDGLLASYRGGT